MQRGKRIGITAMVVIMSQFLYAKEDVAGCPYLHVYGGRGLSGSGTASIKGNNNGQISLDDGSADVLGITLGYWSGRHFPTAGFALDLSRCGYEFDQADTDVTYVSCSVLLMLGASFLHSERVPQGYLQAYAGLGPALVAGNASTQIVGIDVDESILDFAFDSRVGVRVMCTDSIGLFAEWRYFYADMKSGDADLIGFSEPYDSFDLKLESNQILVGAAFNF